MPLAGLIVNRASPQPESDLPADEAATAAARLRRAGDESPTAGMLQLYADHVRVVQREQQLRERFAAAHPQVATAVVPALPGDVHDLEGLRHVGELLARESKA
jgi:hypothetical protein